MMSVLLVALALQATPEETAALAALEKFKTDYKSREIPVRAAAVAELAKTQHDKVYAKLGQLLVVDDIDIRIAAAKGLEGCTGNRKKAAIYLVGALAPNAKDPRVTAPILAALGKLKEESVVGEVEKHLKSRNLEIARTAIEACGEIRAKSSILQIIDLLRTLDKEAVDVPDVGIGGGGKGGGGGLGKGKGGLGGGGIPGQGGNVDAGGKERKDALAPVCHKTLAGITDMRITTTKDWEDWWREHGATFKVPPKN